MGCCCTAQSRPIQPYSRCLTGRNLLYLEDIRCGEGLVVEQRRRTEIIDAILGLESGQHSLKTRPYDWRLWKGPHRLRALHELQLPRTRCGSIRTDVFRVDGRGQENGRLVIGCMRAEIAPGRRCLQGRFVTISYHLTFTGRGAPRSSLPKLSNSKVKPRPFVQTFPG